MTEQYGEYEQVNGAVANRLQKENDELRHLLSDAIATIDDFMPNIGRCALQDYERLNRVKIEAAQILSPTPKLSCREPEGLRSTPALCCTPEEQGT